MDDFIEAMGEIKYDSTEDTSMHIDTVRYNWAKFRNRMALRIEKHDASKLEPPEKEDFDKYTPKLHTLTYGSPEYMKCVDELKKGALAHHYEVNAHHPEHYPDGMNGFDLFDLIELWCDWCAAVKRHDDGDIMKSIEFNAKRFDMPPMLVNILKNTATRYKDEI